MPSGLDHLHSADSRHDDADALYDTILKWAQGMQQVVVMGDLNETRLAKDRASAARAYTAAAVHAKHIDVLEQDGFVDVYRSLHPSPHAGFTHFIVNPPSSSRIDYIWCRGVQPSALLRTCIDTRARALHRLSHHRLLWMEMQVDPAAQTGVAEPLLRLRLPNLRAATPQHVAAFSKQLQHTINEDNLQLHALLASDGDPAVTLNAVAERITSATHRSAFDCFPLTGSRPYENRSMLQLERQRHALTQLLHISSAAARAPPLPRLPRCSLALCPAWRKQYARCVQQLGLQWTIDALDNADPDEWIAETQRKLNQIRTAIRKERTRMQRKPHAPLDTNPAAHVHRMLDSSELPAQLHAVIDSHGSLTSNAHELEDVLVEHFTSVFAVPPPPAAADPPQAEPPAMLHSKESVDPAWYEGLLEDITAEEILSVLADAPLISSPGQDEVSTGLWKLALQGNAQLCSLVASLFSACLRTSTFPAAWKTSVIVPLIKDALKEHGLSNLRPISLQSCLGKLLNKILAHRLSSIFARYPILHPAQRGFINGGSITKCIDELLDAWDWSRKGQAEHELHTLFYDIKQAYDSVQVSVLVRALHRLRLPAAFVSLIEDSLTGLTSCIRTAFGFTRTFAVLRSLRQGDPLAPLLFVILMDALHEGLECNPFSGERHGLAITLLDRQSVSIASLGYADDTTVLAGSLAAMRVQNEWVHYFMRFNLLRLNHSKCEIVGRFAGPRPAELTEADLQAASITIEGNPMQPVAHTHAIRYLGVHCCFDGSWQAQHAKSLGMIHKFTSVVCKFELSLSQARYIFNTFLMPKLELPLHYVHGKGTDTFIRRCNATIVGCIRHAIASPLKLSNRAVAHALGIILPSRLEAAVKVSELFLRINSTQTKCRWGQLGRLLMRAALPTTIDASTSLPHASGPNSTRLTRAVKLAVRLGWTLRLRDRSCSASSRNHLHLFDRPAASERDIAASVGLLSQRLRLSCSPLAPLTLAHDRWQGWGAEAPAPLQAVHLYTDGSFDAASNSSAWAVTVGDEWFDASVGAIPADEKLVTSAHVAGAVMFGASIEGTRGVYPAELQAIARALAMFPLSCPLHLHSDSESSLRAIRSFCEQTNERRRLRMSCRPLLQLIHHLLLRRAGDTTLSHVKAHTTNTDAHSVGNRLSDYHANRSRLRPDRPSPLNLLQLPLSTCEHHLVITDSAGLVLADDIRRTAMHQLKAAELEHWCKLGGAIAQGALAGEAMVDLGKAVLRGGTAAHQAAFVHVATNSIHCFWGSDNKLGQLHCASCGRTQSLHHLVECDALPCVTLRWELAISIRDCLGREPCTRAWLAATRLLPFRDLLLALFPIPAAASDEERQLHLTCLLVGAFTRRQANAAAKLAGFASGEDGRGCLLQLRLRCLEHIERAFGHWKEAAKAI
jgi:ribonuclease HI